MQFATTLRKFVATFNEESRRTTVFNDNLVPRVTSSSGNGHDAISAHMTSVRANEPRELVLMDGESDFLDTNVEFVRHVRRGQPYVNTSDRPGRRVEHCILDDAIQHLSWSIIRAYGGGVTCHAQNISTFQDTGGT